MRTSHGWLDVGMESLVGLNADALLLAGVLVLLQESEQQLQVLVEGVEDL